MVIVLPCGAEPEPMIVFVTLSPVVCPCAIADGTVAKSITPNTSAKDRNKLAGLNFRGKGAIPVLVTATTPERHGQGLSFVISLLLLGWAEPRRRNGWLWEREMVSRCISLLLLQFSLEEKIQHLTPNEFQ